MTLVAGHLSTLHAASSDLHKSTKAIIWPGSPFPYPLNQYGGLEYAILLIMVGVGMVLVIACANVASLQLARAAARQHELGMRLSLGASRFEDHPTVADRKRAAGFGSRSGCVAVQLGLSPDNCGCDR